MKVYGEYVIVKCRECGEVETLKMNNPEGIWYCSKCDSCNQMHGKIAKVHVKCKCERYTKCITNLREKMVEATCPVCKAPVAVEWNPKKFVYLTI